MRYNNEPLVVSSRFLRTIVWNYNKYIPELEKEGIIFIDHSYKVGYYSKAYQLNIEMLQECGYLEQLFKIQDSSYYQFDDHLSQYHSIKETQIDISAIDPNDPAFPQAIAFKAGMYYLFRSPNCRRLYSNLVNIARRLRKHLYLVSGENIYYSDISSTFPTFLIGNMSGTVKMEYIDLIQSGLFYDNLIPYYNGSLTGSYEEQRDQVKVLTNKVISGNPMIIDYNTWKPAKILKQVYPDFYTTLMNLSSKKISLTFQRLESKIILDQVVPELLIPHPRMFHYTIHDCICYTLPIQDEVEKLIEYHVYNAVGLRPRVKSGILNKNPDTYNVYSKS